MEKQDIVQRIKQKMKQLAADYDSIVSASYPSAENKDLLLQEIGARILRKAAIETDFQQYKETLRKLEGGEIEPFQALTMLPNLLKTDEEKKETTEESLIRQWATNKIEREKSH